MTLQNWRHAYRMLEHAVKTLSAFEANTLVKDTDSFETAEFPLLIEDMKEALTDLQSACIALERLATSTSKSELPTRACPVSIVDKN